MIDYLSISQTEGAVVEPVGLEEVKAFLTVDYIDKDTVITSLIKAARQKVESYLNVALVAKTVTVDVELSEESDKVRLPYAKGVSGVVVKELDNSNVETTLASGTDYYIRQSSIRFLNSGIYTISYTTVPNVNEAIKQAIKMEVAQAFDGEDRSKEIEALLANYAEIWL